MSVGLWAHIDVCCGEHPPSVDVHAANFDREQVSLRPPGSPSVFRQVSHVGHPIGRIGD